MSSVKGPLKTQTELTEPLTPQGSAEKPDVDFGDPIDQQSSSNEQSATPQPYEVPEMNNQENSTIIHRNSTIETIEATEENKMPHPRKDSLAIPNNMSYSANSAADSDDGGGDTKKHKGKHKERCPSQSIGQMSQIRTTRHSVKVKSEMSFIANVMRCCVAENGFDLYQVIAFDADTKESWKDWILYIFHVLKAVLCALTQIFGMIIIMIDVWQRGLVEKEMCNALDFEEIHTDPAHFFMEQNLKVLAFLFSSFLAYFSVDMLFGVEKGMYQDMKYAENVPFISSFWLQAGFTVNVIVSIVAVYGSFVVIFFSDNSLDMVLNSVALFFIVELDDLLVDDNDYERIGDYIESYVESEFKKEPEMERNKSLRTKIAKCKKACSCCCDVTTRVLTWMYQLPFQILRYVTIFACIVMPFYVGWCY